MKKISCLFALSLCCFVSINAQSNFQQNGTSLYYNKGYVGIGTVSPSKELTIKGRVAISPNGVVSDEGYNGHLMITKPAASGQYINITRTNNMAWSIGMVYNTNTFAIGNSYSNDAQFTNPYFSISTDGNVGIGTTNPKKKLDVNGTIRAIEVIVESGWADFVFDKSYNLPSLDEVATHIKENKRLPGIPSAEEIAKNGVSLGEINKKLLQKIEEQTLYIIDLQKQIREIKEYLENKEK